MTPTKTLQDQRQRQPPALTALMQTEGPPRCRKSVRCPSKNPSLPLHGRVVAPQLIQKQPDAAPAICYGRRLAVPHWRQQRVQGLARPNGSPSADGPLSCRLLCSSAKGLQLHPSVPPVFISLSTRKTDRMISLLLHPLLLLQGCPDDLELDCQP